MRFWLANQLTEEAQKFRATGTLNRVRVEELTQALLVVDMSDVMLVGGKDYRFAMNDFLKALSSMRNTAKATGTKAGDAATDPDVAAFEKKLAGGKAAPTAAAG